MNENYQRQLDALIEKQQKAGVRPRLLLQACCAPCSSYCLAYLTAYFDVTVYFYNPNIFPREEYDFRLAELRRLLGQMPLSSPVTLQEGPYDPQRFFDAARGHEQDPEPGERCRACYRLRLRQTAEAAKAGGYDFFCTTLSISPHKRADWLNEIGQEIAAGTGVAFLPSDFKKKGGYAASIRYSREYDLYRQNYCGCVYSKALADLKTAPADADGTSRPAR